MKLIILIISCILKWVTAQELKNHVIADKNGNFHVFWGVYGENITIEVQVATKGYVGFGLSPNGGMPGSDAIIGWVLPNGTSYFHDRHALGFYEPLIDSEQNYNLLNAHENETHTVLRFTRKLNTCDKGNDTVITDNTMKIIFSWHPDDPADITGLPYHGPEHRGAKDILFLSPQPPPIQMTDDIVTHEVQIQNATIPAQLTTYWCQGIKLPTFQEPHYYIGYTVHITPGNENIVHHFSLYECKGNITENEEKFQQRKGGYQCMISGELADPLDCQPPILIWAVGSPGQFLPEGVGMSLGQPNGAKTYFLIQMHYNNAEKKAGIVDNSILRLYLTKKEMPKKAGMLQLYPNVDYSMSIPPQQPEFKTITFFPPEFTLKTFPKEGIVLFAVGLHTHLAGRKLVLRHYRGNEELKPIAMDNTFNFNYQEFRAIPEPPIILPGDMLAGTCVFSTMDRNETVMGGLGTDEEMCVFIISYYPEIDVGVCQGGPDYQDIYDFFGVEEVADDKIHIIAPASLKNQSMFNYVKHYDWSQVDDAKMKKYAAMQYEGVLTYTCVGDPKSKEPQIQVPIRYPFDIPPYKEPDYECDLANQTTNQSKVDGYSTKKSTEQISYKTPKLDGYRATKNYY